MVSILVPVDGSKPSERAVKHVIELSAAVCVLLLNVQPPSPATRSRTKRRGDMLRRLDAAEHATRSARVLLERAHISYKRYTRVGSPAQVMLEFARHEKCRQIVMGTRGLGAVAGLVLGSVALKIIELAKMPVTLVK